MIPLLSPALVTSIYPLPVHVGTLSQHSLTRAWGHAYRRRADAIGCGASNTPATVSISGREIQVPRNWVRIHGPASDTDYAYTVQAGGRLRQSPRTISWWFRSRAIRCG